MMQQWIFFICASTMALACTCSSTTTVDSGVEAGPDSGDDAGGDGSTTDCDAGSTRDCYSGPPGTENVGACMIGSETCDAEGADWGACTGEVLPTTEVDTEPGQTLVDEDCDGFFDEAP